MERGLCAGGCGVVANVSHIFQMATIENVTVTKCHANKVIVKVTGLGVRPNCRNVFSVASS